MADLSTKPLTYEDFTHGEVLPCPICGKSIEKGEWFVLAYQAQETIRNGSPCTPGPHGIFIPQQVVHVTCILKDAQR